MELTVDVNPRNREEMDTDITFFSLDAGTAEKIINFTRDHMAFDLTDATVVVGFHFVNGRATKIIDSVDGSVEILDAAAGRVSVKIPSHVYDYEGDVMVHVYLTFTDGTSIDCAVIPTRFEGSWLDEQMPELERTSIERFNLLTAMADEVRDRLEGLEDGIDEADAISKAAFRGHVEDQDNPHSVTAQQVGAAPIDHTHDWAEIIGQSGGALSEHQHDASDINRGVLNINRIPRGTGANQVASGNHTHTLGSLGAAAASHTHAGMATQTWVNDRPGLSTTPWTGLRLENNTNASGNASLQYRRIGRTIYVRGTLTDITNTRVVATLPTGFRPFARSYEFVQTIGGTTGRIGRWRVRPSGEIEVRGAIGQLARTDLHYIFMSFPNI